jgi:hypothetical protein
MESVSTTEDLGSKPTALSAKYAALQINAARINATIQTSCTWGNTGADGGMSRHCFIYSFCEKVLI